MPQTTEELYRELLEQGKNYQNEANDYLNQYDNRGQFSYNAENDPIYQSLRSQYVHQGRRAMEDTMGQAAGLTGGYGSTYSQGAGQQAYNEYLTKLNAQIPGLAQQARSAWDAEGNRLLDRYNLALNAANTAYGQARDALGDLRYDQEYADNKAYQEWQMNRTNQQDAQSYAEMMIKMGLMPSDDVIAATGWSAEDIQRMVEYYKNLQNASGGGKDYTGGPSEDPKEEPTEPTVIETNMPYYNGIRQTLYALAQSGNYTRADQILNDAANSGKISEADLQYLFDYFYTLFPKTNNQNNNSGGNKSNGKGSSGGTGKGGGGGTRNFANAD